MDGLGAKKKEKDMTTVQTVGVPVTSRSDQRVCPDRCNDSHDRSQRSLKQ